MAGSESWTAGDRYEPYVGRWSRRVAGEFLGWLDRPEGLHWLDVGCGTGALTGTIFVACAPLRIDGVDAAAAFVAHARARIVDPRVQFAVADARSLPFASESFDTVVSALMLNFVPDPQQALDEMARVARRDAVLAAYVWDYAEGMQMMRAFWDAAIELDRDAVVLDEARRFPVCSPDGLAAAFGKAGLVDVEVRSVDIPTRFGDFDDYWSPFLGGQGPAPTYAMSLGVAKRDALRDRIRAALPIAADGSIELRARAWAARGRRPPG